MYLDSDNSRIQLATHLLDADLFPYLYMELSVQEKVPYNNIHKMPFLINVKYWKIDLNFFCTFITRQLYCDMSKIADSAHRLVTHQWLYTQAPELKSLVQKQACPLNTTLSVSVWINPYMGNITKKIQK